MLGLGLAKYLPPKKPIPRRQHIFIYDPVHLDRVRPGRELRLEFLTAIPERARSRLQIRCDGRDCHYPIVLGDSVALPPDLPETEIELQVVAETRKGVWVSQWLTLTIDPEADPEMFETGERIYCNIPWLKMNVGKANASPCCNLRRKFRIPFKDDAEGYDPWNSKSMEALRGALVRGSRKYCFPECPHLKNRRAEDGFGRLKKRGVAGYPEDQREAVESFLRGDTVLQSSPTQIKLTVNHFCNHACLFCTRDIRSSWKANEAIFEILERHIDRVQLIALTGGEPLVFLEEMGGRLLQLGDRLKGKCFSITTNGSLIEKSLEFLSMLDSLRLLVSLNAGTRESYRIVHRKDHFDRVIRGIRLIQERRAHKPLYIRIKMVMMQQNRRDIQSYVEIAKTLGVDEVRFTNALLYERADMTEDDQLSAGSPEWTETRSALEAAVDQLSAERIKCTVTGPGWNREDTREGLDPMLWDDDDD